MVTEFFDFQGKKILVTGASSGIGRATAIFLSKCNAKLVITGRDKERLLETLGLLQGENHLYYTIDLSQEVDLIDDMFQYIIQDNQKLDGLVHSAGIVPTIPLQNLNRKKMNEIMSINLFSFIELMRQYEKKKYSNGGSVVAISSIASVQPEKCQTIYASSKAAMNAAVKTLALELLKKNIRVNTILPGVAGDCNVFEQNEDLMALVKKQRMGLIEYKDIPPIIAFLLSNASKFMTGRELYFDACRY